MTPFTRYQKLVVAILAFLQFTIILDFMIMSPLGAFMMPALNITPAQFGFAVSVYAFSAGISGILAAGFADRFDRKRLLLFFYVGFLFGTFLCGIADTYAFLIAARMVTGIFGGVVGSVAMAIITDLFSFELRGRVMGIVQSAFAGSQILGLPVGIFLSNHWGWHAPFLMIVAFAAIVGIIIVMKMEPINEHLKNKVDRNAFHHFKTTMLNPNFTLGFVLTAILSIGGFMLMPFSSAYTVNNIGIPLDKLPMIYLTTGLSAMVMGPLIGRISDKVGKLKVFVFGSLVSAIMVVIYTNLENSTLTTVIIVNMIMFTGIFSRMIPSQALLSGLPDPSSRGAFMAISSSLQQIAGGLASVLAGLIVTEGANGRIEHFNYVGYIMLGTITASLIMMNTISKRLANKRG